VNVSKTNRRPISGEEEHILLEFAHFMSGLRSPASIAAYQSDIRLFAESTSGIDLLNIIDKQEDDYIDSLRRLGLKRRTISRKGTAFRYFRQFLSRIAKSGVTLGAQTGSFSTVVMKSESRNSVFSGSNDIDAALSAFITYIEENRSPSTVRAYTCDLLKFRDCLGNTSHWHQVTKQLISDFLDRQIAAGLNANSTTRLLSTIRSLFGWLQAHDHNNGNPTTTLRLQPGGKSKIVLSISDLLVVSPVNIPTEFQARRNLVAFELLYRCGLRVSEAVALNISSVDLKRRRLVIRGRRDRNRYVHLQEPEIAVLAVYLSDRKGMGADESAPLVVNLRGGRLTTRSLGRIVQRLAISYNLPKGTHPFSLRYAHMVHSLQAGKDIQDIRHDLGVSGIYAVAKFGNS
jgi:integrase/recombinase XerC